MVSSLVWASSRPCVKPLPSIFASRSENKLQPVVGGFRNKEEAAGSVKSADLVSDSLPFMPKILQKSLLPLAASAAVMLSCSPANAGFLSGFSGIESVPGPELPQIDFLNRWNEENQKKYGEADARFRESPLLKKLLEQSKLNKEKIRRFASVLRSGLINLSILMKKIKDEKEDKNQQATLDKYCIRGAEWGVGDCSADAMSPEDREKFISMLKKKAGVE